MHVIPRQITCETPPGAAGSYPVVVKVDNQNTDSICCFNYTSAATPSEEQCAAAEAAC